MGGGIAKKKYDDPSSIKGSASSNMNAIQPRAPGSTTLASLIGKSEQHQKAYQNMQKSQHKKAEFVEI